MCVGVGRLLCVSRGRWLLLFEPALCNQDGRRRVFIPARSAPHPALHACLRVSIRLLLRSIVAWTVYYCRMFVLAPGADIPPTTAAAATATTTPGERKLPGQRKSRDPLWLSPPLD